jgi:hypothetical protein
VRLSLGFVARRDVKRIDAFGDVAERQRGQFGDRRISVRDVADAGEHDSSWKVRIVHAIPDEPAVVLGVDNLTGRFLTREDGSLDGRPQVVGEAASENGNWTWRSNSCGTPRVCRSRSVSR